MKLRKKNSESFNEIASQTAIKHSLPLVGLLLIKIVFYVINCHQGRARRIKDALASKLAISLCEEAAIINATAKHATLWESVELSKTGPTRILYFL